MRRIMSALCFSVNASECLTVENVFDVNLGLVWLDVLVFRVSNRSIATFDHLDWRIFAFPEEIFRVSNRSIAAFEHLDWRLLAWPEDPLKDANVASDRASTSELESLSYGPENVSLNVGLLKHRLPRHLGVNSGVFGNNNISPECSSTKLSRLCTSCSPVQLLLALVMTLGTVSAGCNGLW